MSDGSMSMQDVLQGAIEAENKGIPVDWKSMAMKVYNVAINHIAALEEDLNKEATDDGSDADETH